MPPAGAPPAPPAGEGTAGEDSAAGERLSACARAAARSSSAGGGWSAGGGTLNLTPHAGDKRWRYLWLPAGLPGGFLGFPRLGLAGNLRAARPVLIP